VIFNVRTVFKGRQVTVDATFEGYKHVNIMIIPPSSFFMRYFQLKSTQWKVWLSVEIHQVLKIADHYCLKMCGENVW